MCDISPTLLNSALGHMDLMPGVVEILYVSLDHPFVSSVYGHLTGQQLTICSPEINISGNMTFDKVLCRQKGGVDQTFTTAQQNL